MKEDELSDRCVAKVIGDLLDNQDGTLDKMAAAMADLAVLDAAENICKIIETNCQ